MDFIFFFSAGWKFHFKIVDFILEEILDLKNSSIVTYKTQDQQS